MSEKPNALAIAKRHADKLKTIPVPEWTEDPAEPFTVYAKGIKAGVYRTCKTMATNRQENFFDELKFHALVIEKTALHADGTPMFQSGDYMHLMDEADGDVITRLGSQLVTAQRTLLSLQDQVKN